MKLCSQCNQIYTDDNLKYCLSDKTELIAVVDVPEEATEIEPILSARSQSAAYLLIGVLALLVGSLLVIWIKSDSGILSNSKNEVLIPVSSSNELKPNKEELLNEQKSIPTEKQALFEKEKQIPAGIKIGLIDNSSGQYPMGCGGCCFWNVGKEPKFDAPKTQKYILVADTNNNAWVNINNEIVHLRLVDNMRAHYEKKRERYIATYQADNIMVKVDCKITGYGDLDAIDCDALLTVTKDTQEHSVKAIGNCSC